MGRRLKLTPQLQEEICILIAKGCHVEISCRAVGVSTSSYYSWLAQGEAEEAARQKAAEEGPEWINTKEAQAVTGLPAAKLRKAARAGEFKAEKQGGRWLLDRAGLLLWAEPEGSPYLQFLEAIRQAEAEAETHLVEVWREQTPQDWKAARDLLARRFPQRWSERRLIEANVSADVQSDTRITGEVRHEIEITQEEARGAIQRFRDFLMQEAVEAEAMRMRIEEILNDGESRSFEEIAEALDNDPEKTLARLQEMAKSGVVKEQGDKWALTWTPKADPSLDVETSEAPAAEPPIERQGWTPPAPGPTPGRVPIVAGKTQFSKLRDGDPLD